MMYCDTQNALYCRTLSTAINTSGQLALAYHINIITGVEAVVCTGQMTKKDKVFLDFLITAPEYLQCRNKIGIPVFYSNTTVWKISTKIVNFRTIP